MSDPSALLVERLYAPGPKRILALDGGGIRGAITLGFLGEIERHLSARYAEFGLERPEDFRLHHYFDLVGGTSTGAIIAALIAVRGSSVAEMKGLYAELGRKIFSDRNGLNFFGKRLYAHGKYDSQPLKDELLRIFGDARLGDESNKTGLCVVSKRLDTCSTWPVLNNPKAKYFERNRFFVRDIVRASTAAPTYFDPEIIDIGGETGVFVDGGLSMANNPSLQLFLAATLKGFRLEWETGADRLSLVSVGTGRRSKKLIGKKWNNPNLLSIAQCAPEQFMSDAGELVETMMHYIGRGMGPLRQIDAEIENLGDDALHGSKALSYLRYNVDVTRAELEALGVGGLSEAEVEALMEMDLAENVEQLLEIGEKAGARYVDRTHFI